MNILFHFRTQGTGAEGVHIAGMAGGFRRLGHSVTFLSPGSVDPTATAGENPFQSHRRGLLSRLAARAPRFVFELLEIVYNFVAGVRLVRLLKGGRYDLIYERHAFFLCVTALLAQRRRIPLVVEVNELAGDERIRAQPWLLPLARWADRITFRRADLVVAVSPHLQRRIAALGTPFEKILVLPNAVEESALDQVPNPSPIRERFHGGETTIVGFAGWFVPWHKLDMLVAEFAALAPASSNLRLLLVGDGPLRGALEEQATRLGIADRLLLPGAIPHAEMPNYLNAMDIAVVPHSNAYRSPIKLFEYMAAGRAVVAPCTEPIALVVRHNENGLLFAPENADDLRTQLCRLVSDPALRARLGAQARSDVQAHHTWTRNARAVLDRLSA
jgi:glycosyltransferase involved in cell wall biosynthesis